MAAGAVVSAGMIFAILYGRGIGHDFAVLWRASRSTQPYTPDAHGPFAYPPPALLWLKPIGLLSFWPAYILWSMVSVGCYLAVTRQALLLLGAPAVIQCLVFGQTSLLIAAIILVAADLRPGVRAALIGVAFTLKPQLVFMAPIVLAMRRDWPGLAGFTLGAASSVAVTFLCLGVQPWREWIVALPSFAHVVAARDLYWVTITPYGAAAAFGLSPWPFWAAGALIAVMAAAKASADLTAVVVLSSLLATPYAVAHDLVALVPFALVELERERPNPAWALIYATALVPLAMAAVALGWIFSADREEDRSLSALGRRSEPDLLTPRR